MTYETDAADAAIRSLVRERIEAVERTVQLLDFDQRIELTRWIREGFRLLDADAPKARPSRPFWPRAVEDPPPEAA